MMRRALFGFLLLIFAGLAPSISHAQARPRVAALKITVLSTMLADRGIGEWGYAALVEADGRKILFDTGARPDTVLNNAEELGIDLSDVEDVVVSHHHADHTGGLVTLRRELMKKNPRALIRVHVAEGFFLRRAAENGAVSAGAANARGPYEALGGRFVVHGKGEQIAPGVWFSGPVPRPYPERNYPPQFRIITPGGLVQDIVPEDASLLIDTDQGTVLLTGCGHAGVVNIAEHARTLLGEQPVFAVIGGLHLYNANDERLAWTAAELKRRGLRFLLAGHCTGIEATITLRQLAGLNRKTAVVSSVGSSFSLKDGIDPLAIAR